MPEVFGPIVDVDRDAPDVQLLEQVLTGREYIKARETEDRTRWVSVRYLMSLPADAVARGARPSRPRTGHAAKPLPPAAVPAESAVSQERGRQAQTEHPAADRGGVLSRNAVTCAFVVSVSPGSIQQIRRSRACAALRPRCS